MIPTRKAKGERRKAKAAWRAALPLAFRLSPFALVLAAGCCTTNCDHVEAELRAREADVRELKDELLRTEAHSQALQREVITLRQDHPVAFTPEAAASTYTVKEIVLSRLTGGYDEDGCYGDEALQVIVEPRDCDGHAIKAPGSLHVVALQISPEGTKAPFYAWDVAPDQMRKSWRSGLLSNGYYVLLGWKGPPAFAKLRVVVQLMLPDGRVFEADRDVTIRLPSERERRDPAAPGVPGKPAPVDEALPLLPAPKEVPPPSPPGDTPAQPTVSHHSGSAKPLSSAVKMQKPVAINHPWLEK